MGIRFFARRRSNQAERRRSRFQFKYSRLHTYRRSTHRQLQLEIVCPALYYIVPRNPEMLRWTLCRRMPKGTQHQRVRSTSKEVLRGRCCLFREDMLIRQLTCRTIRGASRGESCLTLYVDSRPPPPTLPRRAVCVTLCSVCL